MAIFRRKPAPAPVAPRLIARYGGPSKGEGDIPYRFRGLGQYHSDRNRGLMLDPDHIAKMEKLRVEFDQWFDYYVSPVSG